MSSTSAGSGARGALPNMLIIGAAKAGTTSLHYYLSLHPEIQMAREKELHFFSNPDCWRRGLDWYRSQFDPRSPVRGESSVSYTADPERPGVAAKIQSVLPDAKLIYILRDPIERILSAWVQRTSMGREHRPIEEALRVLDDNPLVTRSLYHHQLAQYLHEFDRSQILVLTLEEMRDQPGSVLRRAFEFLEVDPEFVSPRFGRVRNPSESHRRKGRVGTALYHLSRTPLAGILPPDVRRKIGTVLYRPFSRRIEPPVLTESTRARLESHLRADVTLLRELTGQGFPAWSI